jgi:hypothetical protein
MEAPPDFTALAAVVYQTTTQEVSIASAEGSSQAGIRTETVSTK